MATSKITPSHIYRAGLTTAGVVISSYHGYKRGGKSVGRAVLWGLGGALLPTIFIAIAFAQGLGKRES